MCGAVLGVRRHLLLAISRCLFREFILLFCRLGFRSMTDLQDKDKNTLMEGVLLLKALCSIAEDSALAN